MVQEKQAQLDYIACVLEETGETASGLARRVGLSSTTLTRFMQKGNTSLLNNSTLSLIANATGIRAPGQTADPTPSAIGRAATRDNDIEPFDLKNPMAYGSSAHIKSYVQSVLKAKPNAAAFIAQTRLLDLEGILPGDIVIVDQDPKPEAGDIIWADAHSRAHRSRRDVLRIYEPPFLVIATTDSQLQKLGRKPIIDDHDLINIKGVVVSVIRGY